MSHDNNPLAIRGQVMLDVEGTVLTDEDRARLAHAATGGVILFSRNYASRDQVAALVNDIREASPDPLLIAVDHEGGRVQRFREGFTHIPPMAWLGKRYDMSREEALNESELLGWLMATELRQVDIDFSFAPVLDVDRGVSEVGPGLTVRVDDLAVVVQVDAVLPDHLGELARVGVLQVVREHHVPEHRTALRQRRVDPRDHRRCGSPSPPNG